MKFVHLRELVALLQQTSKVQDSGNTLRAIHGEAEFSLVYKAGVSYIPSKSVSL